MANLTNTRITYLDGSTVDIAVTMWDRCLAETHGKAENWGSTMDAALKLVVFAAYARLRTEGKVTVPFKDWASTVAAIADTTGENTPESAEVDSDVDPTQAVSSAGTQAATAN